MRRNGIEVVSAASAVSIESVVRFIRTVSVPPRCPAPDCRTPTSTLPPETVTPSGRLPTLIGRPGRFVRGSIRTSVPSNWLVTQTPRASAATRVVPCPVGMTARTEFVAGSIRETVPSRLFTTQAAPLPNAIAEGPFPTAIGYTRLPVVGSMRTTRFAVVSLAHNVPAPRASSVAAIGSGLLGLSLSASILVIVSSPVFATQIEPAA